MSRLCDAADVVAGRVVLVRESQTLSVLVMRLPDGRVAAYRNSCPHMGVELDWEASRLLSRNGRHLRCTGHGALFDVVTGVCVSGPCRGEGLPVLAVREVDGTVVMD